MLNSLKKLSLKRKKAHLKLFLLQKCHVACIMPDEIMFSSVFALKLLHLSLIFFRVGLFTVGGGLAAITLMHQELVPGYIEEKAFYSFVAIAESTPGPIGVNMSTYIGYEEIGVLGSVFVTFAMVLPSFISILIIAKAHSKFQKNAIVQKCFYGLKSASVALIGVAIYRVFLSSVFTLELFKLKKSFAYLIGYKELIFFCFLFALSLTILKKIHPVVFIVASAVCGVFFL